MFRTLKSRVSLVYGSLVIIIAVLGVFSLLSMFQISQAVDGLIITNYHSIQRLRHMDSALSEQRVAILEYIYGVEDSTPQTKFAQQKTLFQSNFSTEYSTIIIPSEMRLITNIQTTYSDFEAMYQHLLNFDMENPQEAQQARNYYTDSILPQIQKVRVEIDALRSSNENSLFSRKLVVKDVITRSIYILGFLFVISIIISYFTSRMYTDKLFRPLYEVTQNLKAVRQGNMNRKSAVRTQDELGLLSTEFNNMMQRLAEFEESTLGQVISEKNKTRSIVRSITEPMIILDAQYRVTLLNHSFENLFHILLAEAQDQYFLDVLAKSSLRTVMSQIAFQAEVYTERVISLELDGEEHFYNVMVTPIRYEDTSNNFVIIVFYDITELKKLERMKSDFIATISHEFKTPLTSMVMGVDLLDNDALGSLSADQQEIIETLREDLERMCTLVNDLLELSKIESSKMIYQFEEVDVVSAIHTSLRQFYPIAEKTGVTIYTQLQDNIPPITADLSKIIWVMNNLLSNAIKYTKEGDSVTVRCWQDSLHVTVEVEDTGVGIPKEFLERIFEKYVHVNNYDLEMRGSGLGLAVSKEIITAHHGTIRCESDLNQGSKFIFTLPLHFSTEEQP
ncbi:MAG: ATP-binding protein [Eubacteriales bacterium]|jgi:PAS domain S-box-containing protein